MSSMILAANPNGYNDIPTVKSIGNKNVEAFTNHSINQRRALVQVTPTSSIPTNVFAGGELQFKLENQIDRIGSVYLRVDWSNQSGADFQFSAPVMHLERVEVYANNGSTLLYQTISPVSNFLIDSVCMHRQEWETTAGIRGTSDAYATGQVTISTGRTGSTYYTIAPNFFRSIKLRTYAIDGNILIRLRFQDASRIITSGTITTTSANLLLSGYYEAAEAKKHCLARAEAPKAFSYWAPQHHIEVMNLTPSQSYTVRLSGINGWVGQLLFALRPIANAISPNNQFSFARPQDFDILDPSQKSLTGFRKVSKDDMVLLYSHLYDNLFINNTNACVYSFSQNPLTDVSKGTVNGVEEMRGAHYLQFTTQSNLVAGSFEILVFALCNESLIIERAQVKTSRT